MSPPKLDAYGCIYGVKGVVLVLLSVPNLIPVGKSVLKI